jgi:molybdenum cofactor cytidylyltransferase
MVHFCGYGKLQFIKEINNKLMAMPGEEYPVTNCAAIILAAGRSKRLGKPKQLLHYKGKTLLERTINAARGASVQSIVLVLGSDSESVINGIDTTGLHIIENGDWQAGIASSIVSGINALYDIAPLPDAAILMVCDQPFVTASLLDQLLSMQKATDKPIIASKYEDTTGTPALFHKSFFQQLLGLKGDSGAKKIMQQYPDVLAVVSFPLGGIDIDTMDDYESLSK